MARVVEYYVEGDGREWERGGSGRVDGVGEGREWARRRSGGGERSGKMSGSGRMSGSGSWRGQREEVEEEEGE